MPRALSRWAAAAALAIALALPLVVHNPYYLQVIVGAYILAIAVYGLNVILGFTGLLSLGHAAFYGVGAYTVALLETRVGMPFWPAIVLGCMASVALGFLVGVISLRTRGHYFAIFTAAIGVMISIVLTNWQALTNGSIGIINIPPPPPLGPISFDGQEPKYYLVLAGLLLAVYVTARLRGSLLGRSMFAIAANEDLARAAGIDVTRVKLTAFLLATFLAGLAGGLFAIFIGFLGPDSSGLDVTFDMLLYLIVGGVSTVAGPLIGTLALVILTQVLQGFEHYRLLIFGPALVILVMFFPGGIAGGLAKLRARIGRGRQPVPAATEAGAVS